MPDWMPTGEIFDFPGGLPSFEQDERFQLSRREGLDPLLFLESARDGGPRFICVPAAVADPGYTVRLDEDAAAGLGLPPGEHTARAADFLVLSLLTFKEGAPPTANLLAPVVLNPERKRGAQIIQFETDYPVAAPLRPAEGGA
jgi:flagellar assembly factor FliW